MSLPNIDDIQLQVLSPGGAVESPPTTPLDSASFESVPLEPVPVSPIETEASDDAPSQGHQTAVVSQAVSLEDVEPAETDGHPTLDHDNSSTHASQNSLASTSLATRLPPALLWLPWSLKRSYLIFLVIVSAALEVVCIILLVDSETNNGLKNARPSSGFTFAWRYLPTVVAVLYTILWIPVARDVVRTEPWALLARSGGSTASNSLLRESSFFWNQIKWALRSTSNTDSVRWPVILSILGSLCSSVLLNPLSAGFFDIEDTTVTQLQSFKSIAASETASITPSIGDVTYIKAIAAIVYNATTSIWIKDQYAILPVWPASVGNVPLTARLTLPPQSWAGVNDVFKLDMQCVPMKPVLRGIEVHLASTDGCEVRVPNAQNTISLANWEQFNGSTASCGSRDYITMQSPDKVRLADSNPGVNGSYRALLCQTNYFMARVPMQISISALSTTVTIDEQAFDREKQPIPASLVNTTRFERAFITQTGQNHLQYLLVDTTADLPNVNGPLKAVAPHYRGSIESMMVAGDLPNYAAKAKNRFFAEVLLNSWTDLAQSGSIAPTSFEISTVSPRLIVTLWVGISICIVLAILLVLATPLIFLTPLSRRPLGLEGDPSTVMAAVLAMREPDTVACFLGLDEEPLHQMHTTFGSQEFFVEHGKISRLSFTTALSALVHSSNQHSASRRRVLARKLGFTEPMVIGDDWRPASLRLWGGASLAVFLLALIIAIAVMFAISKGAGLSDAALVAQRMVFFGHYRLGALAPYSIIPTLIAVIAKLWWEALDDALRLLTPILSILDNPQPALKYATLTYANSPIWWITFKAARNKHWMLALITSGTIAAEILQVLMSALWARQPGFVSYHITLPITQELRTVPHVFSNFASPHSSSRTLEWPGITEYLFGGADYQSSWLFSGLVQSAYNSTPPPFSKDGWSFPAVDFGHISGKFTDNSDRPAARNITFESLALSGRFDCTPITNSSQWTVVQNLSDTKVWNVTTNPTSSGQGFELSKLVRLNYFTSTASNSTPTSIAIGQWLPPGYGDGALGDQSLSRNMTVLWIMSDYPGTYMDTSGQSHYIFSNPPQVTALNCMTILEVANASVTVGVHDNSVQEFRLLSEPRDATEAWVEFEDHFADEASYRSPSRTKYNQTISWGYLWQIALREASASPKELSFGTLSDGQAAFSFHLDDLYFDFYSYAALALADYDREALLEPKTLSNITNKVFTTFYQNFVSLNNGYDGQWAFQPVGAKLPYGLDFEPLTTITTTATSAWTSTRSSLSSCPRRGFQVITSGQETSACVTTIFSTASSTITTTQTFKTYPDTRPASSTTAVSISNLGVPFNPIITRAVEPRAVTTTPTVTAVSGNAIPAVVSIGTELLVISPVAVFFSIAILSFLLALTVTFYLSRSALKKLPRDVGFPASLLGFVYASERLRKWCADQRSGGTRENSEILKMGRFQGRDGMIHWGIEIVEEGDVPDLNDGADGVGTSDPLLPI